MAAIPQVNVLGASCHGAAPRRSRLLEAMSTHTKIHYILWEFPLPCDGERRFHEAKDFNGAIISARLVASVGRKTRAKPP